MSADPRQLGCIGDVLMLLLIAPYGTIWSLNTLFDAKIPLNFSTWFAVVFLLGVLSGRGRSGS